MPSKSREEDPEKAQDSRSLLEAALERLIAGRPTHMSLQRRRFHISVATVSREAAISRTTIYKKHRDLIEQIVKAAEVSPHYSKRRSHHEQQVAKLLERVRELEGAQTKLVSENATLLHRVVEAEKKSAMSVARLGVNRRTDLM